MENGNKNSTSNIPKPGREKNSAETATPRKPRHRAYHGCRQRLTKQMYKVRVRGKFARRTYHEQIKHVLTAKARVPEIFKRN